jgi:hypothetical protein
VIHQYISLKRLSSFTSTEVAKSFQSMRKLIFVISITLDGCCDHTKVIGDDKVHEYLTQLFWNAHVLV